MFFGIGKLFGIHFPFLLINVVGKKNFPATKLQSHSHETNARKKFCKCFFHGRQNFAQTLPLSKSFVQPLLHPQNLRRLFRAAEVELRMVAGFFAHELFAQRRLRGDDEDFLFVVQNFRAAGARADEVK